MRAKRAKPFKVFLSYAHADRERAQKLLNVLWREPDIQVWSDEELTAGSNWEPKLRHELATADLMVVLLTPEGMASNWVQMELNAAWALERTILPVVTRRDYIDRLSIPLGDVQVLDFKDLTSPKGADRFADIVREHLAETQPARS